MFPSMILRWQMRAGAIAVITLVLAAQAQAALMLDMRFADGTAAVDSTGRIVDLSDTATRDFTINIYARVTGTDGSSGNDGLLMLYARVLSGVRTGDSPLLTGGVTGSNITASATHSDFTFLSPVKSQNGVIRDLNPAVDGIDDLGSMGTLLGDKVDYFRPYTKTGTTTSLYKADVVAGGDITGGYEFLVGTITFHVDAFTAGTGKSTTLSIQTPGAIMAGLPTAQWNEDLVQKTSLAGGYGVLAGGGTIVFTASSAAGPAVIDLAPPANRTIIGLGTQVEVNPTVTNAGISPSDPLSYTISGSILSGPGGNVQPTPSEPETGYLPTSASTSHDYWVWAEGAGNYGTKTVQWTVSSAAVGTSVKTSTFTVLDHSHASLAPGTSTTSATLAFNVLKRAGTSGTLQSLPQTININNVALNSPYTAKMNLDSFTANDSTWSTTLATFGVDSGGSDYGGGPLDPGGSRGYQVYMTPAVGTSGSGTVFNKTITIGLSDQKDLGSDAGASNPNTDTLTLNVTARVGDAIASGLNWSPSSPNWDSGTTTLSAYVGSAGDYAGLQSSAVGVSGAGGGTLVKDLIGGSGVPTTATILWGTNSSGSDTSVSMRWRVRSSYDQGLDGPIPGILSDIVEITGMANDGSSGYGRTDKYVLQMNYEEALITAIGHTESSLLAIGRLLLAWWNPAGYWENAHWGNYGVREGVGNIQAAFDPNNAEHLKLGAWGVDVSNNVVWAVLDHGGQFAVIPEPATMVILALGGLAMAGAGLRRRGRKT